MRKSGHSQSSGPAETLILTGYRRIIFIPLEWVPRRIDGYRKLDKFDETVLERPLRKVSLPLKS